MPRSAPTYALFGLLAACDAPVRDADADADVATADWMAAVFPGDDDTPIGRVLIPGAFNSSSYACSPENELSPDAPDVVRLLWGERGTAEDENRQRVVDWAKTQDRPLLQQLEDGIRFLEINLTVHDGALVTWHSVYGAPVAEVLDDVVAFLVAHPDEVVVLSMGPGSEAEDWHLIGEALVAPRADGVSMCDLIYDGAENAALTSVGTVRASGRPLLWSPSGSFREWLDARGDCPSSTFVIDRRWSITDDPSGVEAALADSVDVRDPEHLLINDFVFSLSGADNVGEQAGYIVQYGGQAEVSRELGFAGDFPGRLIETFDVNGNMNVFAGAFYEDTNLVEAVIARNRAR